MRRPWPYPLFTAADLSTPIEEADRLLVPLERGGYDCVMGSRNLPESKIEIHQNRLCETRGKVFNRAARLFSFRGIPDAHCGFKGSRRDVAQKLEGFSFDSDIIFLAQPRGNRILEAPVMGRNSSHSRVQILNDPPAVFADLVRIRFIPGGL